MRHIYIVDALGHSIKLKEDDDDVIPELPELAITAQSYEQDDEFGDMYRYLTSSLLPECNTRARKTSDLFLENGLLYYIENTRSKKLRRLKKIRPRLCLPRSHQSYILDYFHTFLNHASVERLYKSACETVYFHKLYEASHMLVQTCEQCLLGRAQHTVLNKLNQYQIQTEFGRSWHVDFLSLNRMTPGKFKYVLCCVESSCGYIEARLAKTLTSSETARLLVEAIVLHHGSPALLHSDLGSNFCNRVMAKMTAILGIKHKMSSSGNSRSGGRAEICVKAIRHALQITCANDLLIEDNLALVQIGLNAVVSSTTRTSPWFGRNLKEFPILQGITGGTTTELGETDPNITQSDRQYLTNLFRATQQIRNNIALNLADARKKQARYFNAHFHTKQTNFKVNDEVVISSKGPKAHSDRVFTHPKNVGWFRVVKIYNNSHEGEGSAYKLMSLVTNRLLRNPIAGHRLHLVNRDRTKFYRRFPRLDGQQNNNTMTDVTKSSRQDERLTMRDNNSHSSGKQHKGTGATVTTDQDQNDGYLGDGFYEARAVLDRRRTKNGPEWLVQWLDYTSSWLPTRDVSYPLRAAFLARQQEIVMPNARTRRRH